MIKTEAGEKMKKENPVEKKQDINKDGEYEAWEQARQEAIEMAQKFEPQEETPEMNMGGLMHDGIGVIIGIEEESGNEIPAGSKAEEVADDIPAMLSEGEYVVPADVVRWHGVKTFEEMRCEAKMGMGLMAQDGRIAEVDGEAYEHGHDDPEYDIEEKDKPEVEEHKVEVVEAAEGVSIQDGAENISAVDIATTPTLQAPWKGLRQSYYGYKTVYNPETKRYEFKPVDPETDEFVEEEEFDPDKATRFTPRKVVAQEVYGTPGVTDEEAAEMEEGETVEDTEEEDTTEETPTCPAGTVYDENLKACVPEMGTDGPADSSKGPSYGYTTEELDDALGGLYGEQYEKDLNATKVTNPIAKAVLPGLAIVAIEKVKEAAVRNEYLDKVRAGEHLSKSTLDPSVAEQYGIDVDPVDYSNWRENMSNGLTGSVAITEYEARNAVSSGNIQGTSFGSEAEAKAVAETGWGSDDVFAEIEKGFDMEAVTSTTAERAKAQQEKVAEEERQRIAAEQRAREAAAQRAREAEARRAAEQAELDRIQAEREAANQAAARTDKQKQMDIDSRTISEKIASGEGGGPSEGGAETGKAEAAAGSDYSSDPTGYSGSFNKGGYVAKKNTPRKTMIKY